MPLFTHDCPKCCEPFDVLIIGSRPFSRACPKCETTGVQREVQLVQRQPYDHTVNDGSGFKHAPE